MAAPTKARGRPVPARVGHCRRQGRLGSVMSPIQQFAAVLAIAILAGCAQARLPAPPESVHETAAIPGYQNVRLWGDAAPDNLNDFFGATMQQTAARAAREGGLPNGGRFHVLVLSGGGTDGPYGAGLLKAWSERGDRPEFGVVTGVSVGALIAPFAFLGSDYDATVERLFMSSETEEVAQSANLFTGLLRQSLGINPRRPLDRLLAGMIDSDFVAAIARQHALGRRLFIGTTNLDAERPVIWDIGQIASTGRADAPELIRRILLASATIPGAFPPVFIEVEANGRRYAEMHVDGGATNQLFFYPYSLDLPDEFTRLLSPAGPATIHAIRNAKIDPDYRQAEAGPLSVAGRALQVVIKSNSRSDVRQLAERAGRDGFYLNVAAVPEEFDVSPERAFDRDYMIALYRLGYQHMKEGDPWRIVVPKVEGDLTIAADRS